jgi:hypothetical protein
MRRLLIIHIIFLCVIACAFCGVLWFMPEQGSRPLDLTSFDNQIVKYSVFGVMGVVGIGSVFLLMERLIFRRGEGLISLWYSGLAFYVFLAEDVAVVRNNLPKCGSGASEMVQFIFMMLLLTAFVGMISLGLLYLGLLIMRVEQNFSAYLLLIFDGFVLSLMAMSGIWGWIPVVLGVGSLGYFFWRGFEDEPVFESASHSGSALDAITYRGPDDSEHW